MKTFFKQTCLLGGVCLAFVGLTGCSPKVGANDPAAKIGPAPPPAPPPGWAMHHGPRPGNATSPTTPR